MIKAKKKFGQNFLIDESILQQIFQATPKVKKIVEVGGGLGDLTRWLLRTGAKVRCYEIDSELYGLLRRKFAGEIAAGALELVCGDVLERWEELGRDGDFGGRVGVRVGADLGAGAGFVAGFGSRVGANSSADLSADFDGKNAGENRGESSPNSNLDECGGESYALVANLPYYVATNIILKALQDARCTHLLVMTQLEVAQKFAAKAGEREFCALSVLAQSVARVRLLFAVPASAFNPPPKVVSAVVEFVKGEQDLAVNGGAGGLLGADFWAELGAAESGANSNLSAFADKPNSNLGEIDGAAVDFASFEKNNQNADLQNKAQNAGEVFAKTTQNADKALQNATPNASRAATITQTATPAQNANTAKPQEKVAQTAQNAAAQAKAARQAALQRVVGDGGFHDFLRAAFSAPRKKLLKNLSLAAHPLIPTNARPHELCAELYLKLFKGLKWKTLDQSQTKNGGLDGTNQT